MFYSLLRCGCLWMEDYISLLWDYLCLFYPWVVSQHQHQFFFCRKYHLIDTNTIFKNPYRFETWMGCRTKIGWELLLSLDVFFWCPLGSYLCKHAGGYLVTTEACTTPHLTSRVRVVWRSESSLKLSALGRYVIIRKWRDAQCIHRENMVHLIGL